VGAVAWTPPLGDRSAANVSACRLTSCAVDPSCWSRRCQRAAAVEQSVHGDGGPETGVGRLAGFCSVGAIASSASRAYRCRRQVALAELQRNEGFSAATSRTMRAGRQQHHVLLRLLPTGEGARVSIAGVMRCTGRCCPTTTSRPSRVQNWMWQRLHPLDAEFVPRHPNWCLL